MNARELFRPKRPVWLAVTGALLLVFLATFAIVTWWKAGSPGSVWGLNVRIDCAGHHAGRKRCIRCAAA